MRTATTSDIKVYARTKGIRAIGKKVGACIIRNYRVADRYILDERGLQSPIGVIFGARRKTSRPVSGMNRERRERNGGEREKKGQCKRIE